MQLGRRLREARTDKGLALVDISRRTNIPVPVLDALERGDLTRIPGGFFIRAYLRAYAGQVGLDPEQVVAAFHAEHEPRPVEDELRDLRRCHARRNEYDSRRVQAIVFAIGLAILLIFGFLLTRPAATTASHPAIGGGPPGALFDSGS